MKDRFYLCFNSLICLSVLILFLFLPLCFAESFNETNDALLEAENDLNKAFFSLAEAENAGADVSLLTDKLSIAGGLLSEAFVTFRNENYEYAFSLASACSDTVAGVVDDAESLRLSAESANSDRMLVNLILSCVGLVLLSIFGFLGWRLLKKFHFKRVSELKPMLVESQ